MLADIVIDTNVLVDSGNPNAERFSDSVQLTTDLLNKTTILRVDPGYTNDPATNTSLILYEYQSKLTAGSVGLNVIATLAASGRVVDIGEMPNLGIRRKVNQLIRNRRDRTFLLVAIKSDDNVLVSHDYVDFQKAKRKSISRALGVKVIEAGACCQIL